MLESSAALSASALPPPQPRTWILDFFLLAAGVALLLGPHLGRRALWEPDEGRYAEIPREMVESGDYLTPRINGIKYFEKPPLAYWATAGAIRLAGPSETAVRAPLALFALLGCAAVYAAGRRLFGRRAGLWAAAVLLTSPLYLGLGHVLTLDMPVSALLTASLLAFLVAVREPPGGRRRAQVLVFYAFAALAVLTKGLIGVVIPGLVIGAWIAVTRQWRLVKVALAPAGILVFLAIAAPWHLLAARAHPEFAWFYFVHEHFLRYLTKVHKRYEPPWFFLPVLLGGLLPWTAFLPQALAGAWKETGETRRETAFLVLWAVLVVAFFSISDSKLIPYVLPAVPPLALLVGRFLAGLSGDPAREDAGPPSPPNGGRTALAALAVLGLAEAAFVVFWPGPAAGTKGRILYETLGGFRPALAAGFALTGIVPWALHRAGSKAAFPALAAGSALVWSLLFASLPRYDAFQSTKPLAEALAPRLRPGDEIVTYHRYYQTLPFYLRRRVDVVAYAGELEYGMEHEDTRAWMIDEAELWRRWRGPGRVYLVAESSKLPPALALGSRAVARSGIYELRANR